MHTCENIIWKEDHCAAILRPQWFLVENGSIMLEDRDGSFGFTCVKAYSETSYILSVSSLESTYISSGYTNWKDASAKFADHKDSRCHKEAVLKMVTLPATTRDIADSL